MYTLVDSPESNLALLQFRNLEADPPAGLVVPEPAAALQARAEQEQEQQGPVADEAAAAELGAVEALAGLLQQVDLEEQWPNEMISQFGRDLYNVLVYEVRSKLASGAPGLQLLTRCAPVRLSMHGTASMQVHEPQGHGQLPFDQLQAIDNNPGVEVQPNLFVQDPEQLPFQLLQFRYCRCLSPSAGQLRHCMPCYPHLLSCAQRHAAASGRASWCSPTWVRHSR